MDDQTSTIPNEWSKCPLGDVIELIIDHRGLTPKKLGGDWSDSGYRAISAKSVKDGRIVNEDQMNLLSEALYKRWMRDEIRFADIFLTSEAPLGEHIIWKSEEKLVLSQRIFGIRTKDELLDPFYFNYFIDSDFYQHELKSRESGSTVSGIKQSELLQTTILLPTLPEQRTIASVLTSLDEKIELLREQNKTLEGTAQVIFKEWFVNFNFPGSTGKMTDSEFGEIPEGWRVGKLGDQIEIFDSKRIPLASDVRAKRKGNYPYYGATSIMDYIDDYLFDGTYLLLAEDGSVIDKNGYPVMQYVWGQFWVSNHSHVLQGKNGFSTEILYIFMKNANVAGIVNGAVQLKINKTNLVNYELIIPPTELLQKYDSLLQPLFIKVKNIENQIKTLSTLRDTLLPKLITGKIRVKTFNDSNICKN